MKKEEAEKKLPEKEMAKTEISLSQPFGIAKNKLPKENKMKEIKTRRVEILHPTRSHDGTELFQPGEIVEFSPMVAKALIASQRARIIFSHGVPTKDIFIRDFDGDPIKFSLKIS